MSITEPKAKEFSTRSKRDAETLVSRLNGVDQRYKARLVVLVDVDSTSPSCWGVSHNLPEWAVREAAKQAYRRGAMMQVDYLEKHLRDCYPESDRGWRLVLYRRNEGLAPASAGEHLYHEDYGKMYVGEISRLTSLEDVYTRFNEKRPEGFREEPLAVGDIVVIEQEPLTVDRHSRHHEGNPWAPPAEIAATAHYVCAVGFREKPEFAEAHIRGELLQFCEREGYYGHIDLLGRYQNGCVDVVETGFFKGKEAYEAEREEMGHRGEPCQCSRFGDTERIPRRSVQPERVVSLREELERA